MILNINIIKRLDEFSFTQYIDVILHLIVETFVNTDSLRYQDSSVCAKISDNYL